MAAFLLILVWVHLSLCLLYPAKGVLSRICIFYELLSNVISQLVLESLQKRRLCFIQRHG